MNPTQPQNLLGAHMSISGGFDKAIERGASIGCTAIQIFTKSNRQWYTKEIQSDEIQAFHHAQKTHNIYSIVAHASYLINIGSPNQDTAKKSSLALAQELERCTALGIKYLVFHPGAHTGSGEEACLDRIAEHISYVLAQVPGHSMLLLETMSGQGSTVCYSFEHIAYIISKVSDKSRIGVCLDTCHIFAAGYNCTTPDSYRQLWHSFDTLIGRNYLKALHFNDSKKPCGSRVDRHECIGKGAIGLEGFSLFMNDKTLHEIPKIVETPFTNKHTMLVEFKENIDTLKKLIYTEEKSK